MSVIQKDQNGVDHVIDSLSDWETKRGQPAQGNEDLGSFMNYAVGAFTEAGKDPEEAYGKLSQNLFRTAVERGFVQAPAQDDPEADAKLNESFRAFSNEITQSTEQDYGALANALQDIDPPASATFQSYVDRKKEAKQTNQLLVQTPEEDAAFSDLVNKYATPDQIRDARIKQAKEQGLSYVDYVADDKGQRGVWINPDPAIGKDSKSILESYKRSNGLNNPSTLKFAQKLTEVTPGRTTARWQDQYQAEIQQWITGSADRVGSKDEESASIARELQDTLKSAAQIQNEALSQGAPISDALKTETTKQVPTGYSPGPMGYGGAPTYKVEKTGKIAETQISGLYDRLKQAYPNNAIFSNYTKEQFTNAAADLVKRDLKVPTNNEDPTKNFVKLSDGTFTPLSSSALLPKEKFDEAMVKLGLDDRAKAAAEITRKGYLAYDSDSIVSALETFDPEKFNDYRIKWLATQDPTKKPNQTQMIEDYMSEASRRTDWNVLSAKASGVALSVAKAFNPIIQAIGGGVSHAAGFEKGKDFFMDWAVGDAEAESARQKYANLYGSDLGIGYQFASQAAPMIADIALSGGVSAIAKKIGAAAIRETLVAGAEAGATASMRNLIPSSAQEFAGNIGKNWIAKALSPETRTLFGQSYIRKFANVAPDVLRADSAAVNKVFQGIKSDMANRVLPGLAGKTAQRLSSFSRSGSSQYIDTTIGMRSQTNADNSRKFTDEEIHKAALTQGLVAGSITALIENTAGKVFGEGADAINYGHVNLRQLKYYTSRVSGALERSSLGGDEVLGAIKSVILEAAKDSGYGIVKQGAGEFVEEFSDTLAQSVAQAMLTNKDLNLTDALKDAFQSGVIGFGYGSGIPAAQNLRKVNEGRDRQQGVAQSVEATFLSNVITKLEQDGQSPETVAALKNRLQIANRNFQPVSERIPVRAVAPSLVTALDEVQEQPLNIGQTPTVLTPSGSVPTALAAKKAAELNVSPEELNSIQGSGKPNKKGQATVTPNDVQAYVAQRAKRVAQESDIDWNDQAQVEAYLTRNGVKFVSEGDGPTPTVDETRTFKDLNGQLVVINGTRGRVRVEGDGVLLDPENNEPPIEVAPNADMPATEFEGFEGAVAEPSLVSPRRGVRRVALTVSDAGEIVYGKTRYSAPASPSLVNVKLDANGDIDSMYVLVQNKNGKAVYAYVTGANAQKLRQVYESRGPESAESFNVAIASSKAVDVQRNQAAAAAKQKQSNKRRKDKRQRNGAPFVSDQGQAVAEAESNFALNRITDNTVSPKLVDELRSVATQLGLDPDAFGTTEELFRIVGPELAAGLDLANFSQAQITEAVQNVQQGRTNTLLDFLVQQDAMTPANRAIQANHFAKLRAKHRTQFVKHGIKEGAMDVKAVLQSIVRSGKSKQHRETAKFLLSVGADQCPVYVYNAPNDVATTGSYLGSSKIIALNSASDNGGGIVDALLHELTHFGTAEILSNPKNDFQRDVRARLLALRAETQARIEAKYGNAIPEDLRYAVEGRMKETETFDENYAVNEFVAHYFASQNFRLQLDGLAENGQRSLYQKFLDIIGSWFSGKRLADPESRALAEAVLDLKKAVAEGNGLPARSVQQVLASRAAVAREDGFGPMFGVPNPHSRKSFKWINHQTDSLQDGIFSEDQLRALIKTGKFGAFTAENPDATVPTEEANVAFNERAKQWMAERGYVADIVVGRYGNGENSFLVEGFTDQDAVDFANEFGQESMATDKGLFYQDGMYQPRNGENLDTPADEASDDNFFTNVRTTEGKIITVRVMYAENKVDSGLRPSKDVVTATGSESQIVRQVQNQKEFATVLSKDTAKPFVLDGNTLLVNEGLVNEVYGNYAFDEQTSLVERDLAVAVAHELAIQKVGYDTHVAFEDAGLNTAQVLERAASNDLTASDLQDLLTLGDQAKDFVAAAFAEIGLRNNGENERLALAQNRLGDLYRYLQRDGDDIPQEPTPFSESLSDSDSAIIERLRPVTPTALFSKAYSGFNAADLKPGQALGTRNPTGTTATESGLDPMSLISLDVMARDPKAYRTNALYLTEYPIVAREFPELAATVRGLRTEHEKTSGKIRVNADQIKRYKKILKDLLTVEKVKATDAQFENALLLENGGLAGDAGNEFAKNQSALEKCLLKSTELKALGTQQKSAITKTLAGFASDPNHPIATLAPQIYDVVIQNTQSNLEALINLFPKSLRNVAKLWYDGANKIANEFGAQYSQDVEQASGVLAVFSPQKDWFMNIALAERTMKIWHDQVILGNPNGLVWSPEMTAQWLKRGGEPQITTEATDGTKPIYEKGKVKAVYDSNGEHALDEQGNPMFTGWSSANAEAGRNKAREILKNVEGLALKDLAIENQARFIRMFSEVNDSPAFMKYAPDGTNTQEASRSETSGKEIKIGWGSYSTVQKAIRIMSSDKATKLKVVSKELGNMHKVRSFYNNIVDPNNEDGHVTMDTHAVAALYWQALSGNSFEVSQNFGSSNVTNNSILGVNGMYAANAEAYRNAAQTFGLLPREIQSITWEAVRLLFPAKWKSNKKNVDAVRAVWAQYEQDKNFTIEDVRAAVFQLATGKDINEAFANTEDLAKSLGFPSWAQVELRKGEAGEVPLEQATSTVQKSRASVTEQDILNRLRAPKVSVNPPNGQTLYVTGYHGGTFDGGTPMKASSEGVYGYGYYTTPDVTRAKDYAVMARKEMGQAEVTTFDLLLKKPLVVKVSNKARGPALVFEALGLSEEKAEAKAEHLFEQYGNIGKHFKSLGEKQGYDGLVILNADGTIAESVAWTRDSLTVDDNAPTIQFSRAALAPTTDQESKAFASANKNKRSGELAVAAVRLAEGQIDNATFADLVEVLDPWVVKGAQAIPPIEQVKQYIVPRRDGKVFSADEESKIAKVKEELDIPEGQVIDWRIDIPTYNRSLGAGEVTYAITAHPLNNVGKVIGYTNIARVKNGRVMTRVEKGKPMTIAQGNAKFPLATVQGEHVKIDRLPADINDPKVWVETAYNPARSSEFVDVRTKLPVLTFDDAILVGSRVFMKNPTYDSKPRYQQPRVNLAGELTGEIDIRYSRTATPQMDADYLAAVEAGNTAAAQRMVDEAARAAGYTVKAYHGTNAADISTFKKRGVPVNFQNAQRLLGFFFASDPSYASQYGKTVMPAYLSGTFSEEPTSAINNIENGSDSNAKQWKKRRIDKGFSGSKFGSGASQELVVFSPEQIKSADPITRDANGNVIPLSERFNVATPDIRYSRASVQADEDYLAAVGSGDTVTAQSMVNNAAVNAGYSEQTFYRGQRKFLDKLVKPTRTQKPSAVADFINKFFPSKASRGMAWLTDSKYLANQYAVMGDYKLSAMPSALAQRPDLITEGQYGLYSGGGVLQSAKLDLRNSLEVDANGSVWTEVQFEGKKLTSDQIADIAKERGFDSVVIANVKDGFTGMAMNETATVVAVFEDTKIKSADAVTYDNNGTAIPISQRFDQAVPNIRYSKSAAPALFRGKEVQLTHWSFDSDLKTTDPTMHGTGGIGSEKDRKRDYKKIYQPRTYFGYSSYVREYIIGPNRYQIKVAGDSLYDYEADPMDLYPSRDERVAAGYARFDDRAANTMYEKAIKDKGFAGFVCKSHTAGVLFGKHKVTKVPDSDRSLALNPKPKAPKPLLSRAVTAVTSPDIESAYRISLDDLAVNEVTGEYNFGTWYSRLLRTSGNLDPRMFEAKQYQERAMSLANQRVAGLNKTFLYALKKEPSVDLDDVNIALGTTAPTVSAVDRDSARTTRDAAIEAANAQYQETNKPYARYKKATAQARADYLVHQDVKRYQAEVTTLQAELDNSPEKQTRNAAITAANFAYDASIQAGRARGVKAAMAAQQQALHRLEQTSPRIAEVVTEFRSAIDSLSQQLVESLGPNDPMRAVVTENLGVYLTRTYQIHHDEGYAQKIKEDPTFAQTRKEARDFFEKAWVKRTFQSWRSNDLYAVYTDAEVQALVEAEARSKSIGTIELDNFIEQHGSTPEVPGKVLNKTDLSRFMEKGEVPRELVAILGEVQNPIENAIRTYTNLAKFLGTQRLLNNFTKLGVENGWLVTAEQKASDPEKYRLYEPLLNSTKTLGGEPLSNFYAQPEVRESFKLSFSPEGKAPTNDALEVIKGIELVMAKGIGASLGVITLGSFGFYTRNFATNLAYMAANGFIATPSKIGDAIKGLNELYGSNFLNRTAQLLPESIRPDEKFSLSELGPLGADLIALGLKDSVNAGVLRDLFKGMEQDPSNLAARLEESIRGFGKAASVAVDVAKVALTPVTVAAKGGSALYESATNVAEAIDLLYKFAYYSHEVKTLTEANAYNTTKWTDTQIKQMAARTVRKTTQGKAEIPAVVKAFQKSPLLAVLFNSFFRFTTETFRVIYVTSAIAKQEISSGNPVLIARGKKRAGGMGAVLAFSAVTELVKLIGGFDDEEEQSIRNGLPAWAQNVNYYFTRDSKEPTKIKMWNLTYVHPFSLVADPFIRSFHLAFNKRGDEVPAVFGQAIANAFLSPQIAVDALAKIRNNVNDRGGKIWYEQDNAAVAGMKIIKFLANTAYRLKSPMKFYEAFEAYTNNSIRDKDARLSTALEIMGNEFSPFQTRKYDLHRLANQAFAKIKRGQDDVSVERGKFNARDPLSSQDVEEVYTNLENARVYAAEKIVQTVRGLRKLGLPEQEIKRQANDVGISRERYDQIVNRNVVDRLVFQKDLYDEMLERGGEANGKARVEYLKKVIQGRPRFIPIKP